MGIIASALGYGVDTGRTDDPHPDTGLTSRERYLIKSSWEVIMKNPTGNGIKLFMKLFDINPTYHQLFPFRNVALEDLPKNKRFHAHCNTVIYSFASIVSAIDDAQLLTQINAKIGLAHMKRNVDERALKDVKEAALHTFSFMSKDELAAWNKALDAAFHIMAQTMKDKASWKTLDDD